MASRSQSQADSITNYCCFLQSVDAGAHGGGFIAELKKLRSANLLALNWKTHGKTGELQTDYVLITSHDTIPGLSLSDLESNRWTVHVEASRMVMSRSWATSFVELFPVAVLKVCLQDTLQKPQYFFHTPVMRVVISNSISQFSSSTNHLRYCCKRVPSPRQWYQSRNI